MEIKDIDKAIVTKKFPKARCQEITPIGIGSSSGFVIYDYDLVDADIIGNGMSEAEAWENAMDRLED